MLAIFDKSVANPPKELSLPSIPRNLITEQITREFLSKRPDSTLYNLSKGNYLSLSHQDENPAHPRSLVAIDDIFCMFSGILENTSTLRQHYGLSRQATEPMIILEAYRVLQERAPYPPDQVIKQLQGNFAFILFDPKASTVFLARDRDGCIELHWGTAADGSLVCSDDQEFITGACGKCYTPFPPGCMFTSGHGVMSFDHPLNKVRAIEREDEKGNINAVLFQVDLFSRLQSIPRSGSASTWADPMVIESD